MTWQPCAASEIREFDMVRRTQRAKTRYVTGVETLPNGKIRVTFEDSAYPYWLDTEPANRWWRDA